MKTSELTGAALDWAVAKCEPDDTLAIYFDESTGEPLCHDDWPNNQEYKPSTDWAQGGPIIERERIPNNGDLAEAMRCFVASKLGDTVDVPEELNHDRS